jgi:hypothetical protein
VSRILKLVGLIPKVIVRSGCKDAGAIEKLGGRVLGHIWRPELDQIIFKLEVNLHEKICGVVTGPSLTLDTLHTLNTEVFTKRKVLSIISSFYDPMGLISAYLVIFKIMIPNLDWDTPLTEEMQKDWKAAIRLLVEQEEVVFDRGTKPANALGRPDLVGYWDGSLLAYAALLYIRWLLDTDPPSWKSSLLCA